MAVVLPTDTVLPMLPILIRRTGGLPLSGALRKPNIVLLFLPLRLPSLLPELPSGTLVRALRIPGRSRCGFIAVDVAAVISPRGGKCELYSSAKLI